MNRDADAALDRARTRQPAGVRAKAVSASLGGLATALQMLSPSCGVCHRWKLPNTCSLQRAVSEDKYLCALQPFSLDPNGAGGEWPAPTGQEGPGLAPRRAGEGEVG